MGNYTDFRFECSLKKNTPDDVLKVLSYILSPPDYDTPEEKEIAVMHDHPFFKTRRWMCINGQFQEPKSDLDVNIYVTRDAVSFYGCFKDYDNESDLFLEWIEPHIDFDQEVIAWTEYEDWDSDRHHYQFISQRVNKLAAAATEVLTALKPTQSTRPANMKRKPSTVKKAQKLARRNNRT